MRAVFDLRGKVWRHPSAAGWYFVTVPRAVGREIREVFGGAPGWGAVRVSVTLGATTWETSVFPDRQSGSYLLPLKSGVRRAERVAEGASIRYRIAVAR